MSSPNSAKISLAFATAAPTMAFSLGVKTISQPEAIKPHASFQRHDFRHGQYASISTFAIKAKAMSVFPEVNVTKIDRLLILF
jgi:hypothetical protein